MSIFLVALLVLRQLLAPLAGYLLFQHTTSKVGIYWWGGTVGGLKAGYVTGQSKLDAYLTAVGGSVARVTLSPASDQAYTGGACITFPVTLTGLAQTTTWQTIFSDANVTTFVITGYDFVSWPNCGTKSYLNPAFFTAANTAAVSAEWQALATYLGSTYPTKTFILNAWEGDNDCWCGSSFTATAGSCPAGPSNISGYTLWMKARTAGIQAAAKGNVKSAMEMNDIGPLSSQGLPNIMQNVLPSVPVDFISYSSWESKATPAALANDLTTIRKFVAAKSGATLFIGELGVPNSYATDSTQMVLYINVARSFNVPYIIVWQLLYDASNGLSYYDTNGNATSFGLPNFGPQ
jgi:hypothetical protein